VIIVSTLDNQSHCINIAVESFTGLDCSKLNITSEQGYIRIQENEDKRILIVLGYDVNATIRAADALMAGGLVGLGVYI
jgi:hypothetical protein